MHSRSLRTILIAGLYFATPIKVSPLALKRLPYL